MKKTGRGGELKRNRKRQQSKESDSILQPHQACIKQLQLQGTCIARFAILCLEHITSFSSLSVSQLLKSIIYLIIVQFKARSPFVLKHTTSQVQELFLFLRGRTCAHFFLRACAGRVTFLATFCFVYPPYKVVKPSETNSARQNVRKARSRALRVLVCMEYLQLQGTCIARFTILCYQSASLVSYGIASWTNLALRHLKYIVNVGRSLISRQRLTRPGPAVETCIRNTVLWCAASFSLKDASPGQ